MWTGDTRQPQTRWRTSQRLWVAAALRALLPPHGSYDCQIFTGRVLHAAQNNFVFINWLSPTWPSVYEKQEVVLRCMTLGEAAGKGSTCQSHKTKVWTLNKTPFTLSFIYMAPIWKLLNRFLLFVSLIEEQSNHQVNHLIQSRSFFSSLMTTSRREVMHWTQASVQNTSAWTIISKLPFQVLQKPLFACFPPTTGASGLSVNSSDMEKVCSV